MCFPSWPVCRTAVALSRGSWPGTEPVYAVFVLIYCCCADVDSEEPQRGEFVLPSLLITFAVGSRVVELSEETCPGTPGEHESERVGIGRLGCFGLSLKATFVGTSFTPARTAAFSKQLHCVKLASVQTRP